MSTLYRWQYINKTKLLDKVFELINQNIEYSVNRHPRYDCPYSDLNEISRVGVVSAKKSLSWAKRLNSLNIKKIQAITNVIFF